MNKQDIIKQFSKEEDKFLAAKLLDKMQFVSSRNQVQVTDFLDGYEQKIVQKVLGQNHFANVIFNGGYEEAERKMVIFFPTKLQELFDKPIQENAILLEQIQVISIILPNPLREQYHHRDYLSGLMKLGVKREKIGDIIVREDGADILVQKDIVTYLLTNLPELTRFQKAEILQKSIVELNVVPVKKEVLTILIPQLRLDVVIAELLHISRTKANEVIIQERVFVNYEMKTKNSFLLQTGDLLTIRGKGKFQIGDIIGQTSKGKLKVVVEKYVS